MLFRPVVFPLKRKVPLLLLEPPKKLIPLFPSAFHWFAPVPLAALAVRSVINIPVPVLPIVPTAIFVGNVEPVRLVNVNELPDVKSNNDGAVACPQDKLEIKNKPNSNACLLNKSKSFFIKKIFFNSPQRYMIITIYLTIEVNKVLNYNSVAGLPTKSRRYYNLL
jgi:hypothetical protein